MKALRYGISDTLVLAKRSLLRIPRQPDLLVGFTIQPILFVLLFVYVFGGAIKTPGFDYVDFLMPGIIVQSIVFGGFVTALGLADDLKKGLMDRFRSLPMTRSALLTGRTLGDVVTNIFQLVVMFTVGLLIGFNFSSSVGEVVAGIVLLLLIGYAFSWVFAFIGLSSSSPEAANAYGFTILFPVTFVSSAFVPVDTMPSWLQPIAEHNPFTYMVDAARALFLGIPAGNNVWLALVWTLGDHCRLRAALGMALPARRRQVKIVLRGGLELEDPLDVTVKFVEAYPGYDSRDSPPGLLRRERPEAREPRRRAQSAAEIAAISNASVGSNGPCARSLPKRRWPKSRFRGESLTRLFDAFAGISGIGFSKMTKALHPKRRALIPMLDSVVQLYLVHGRAEGRRFARSAGDDPPTKATSKTSIEISPLCAKSSVTLPSRGHHLADRGADSRRPDLVGPRADRAMSSALVHHRPHRMMCGFVSGDTIEAQVHNQTHPGRNHVVGHRNRRWHLVHRLGLHARPHDPQKWAWVDVLLRDLLPNTLDRRRLHETAGDRSGALGAQI